MVADCDDCTCREARDDLLSLYQIKNIITIFHRTYIKLKYNLDNIPSNLYQIFRGVWEQSFSAVLKQYCSIEQYCGIIYFEVFDNSSEISVY
jgi:hypothetical protein